ncbi:MAG TPA: hypothetical protein VFR11_06740 [Micromonosporaceae bacterium]|nr:hypothetical protein [Micromonosporaceae bacterium]
MDPWHDDDGEASGGRPPHGPSNWGCALAAIIGSVAVIVAIVIGLAIANGIASDVLKELR